MRSRRQSAKRSLFRNMPVSKSEKRSALCGFTERSRVPRDQSGEMHAAVPWLSSGRKREFLAWCMTKP